MELFCEPIEVTSDVSRFLSYEGPKLNYSSERIAAGELFIHPVPLLFENDIRQQEINCFEWEGMKAFFRTEGDLPFDLPQQYFIS